MASNHTPPSDMFCPYVPPERIETRSWRGSVTVTERRRPMSETCPACPLWMHVRGKNPQTNEEVDSWNCALAHAPILNVEVIRNLRGVQAAVESRGNEQIKLLAEGILRQERQHNSAMSLASANHGVEPPRQLTNGNGDGQQMALPIEEPPYAEIEDMA